LRPSRPEQEKQSKSKADQSKSKQSRAKDKAKANARQGRPEQKQSRPKKQRRATNRKTKAASNSKEEQRKTQAALSVRSLPRFFDILGVFSIKNRSKKCSKFNMFFLSFLIAFGVRFGDFWEAKIDSRWAKLGSRRLLKRYALKNVDVQKKF